MGLTSIQKISKSGNSLIVILPKKITELMDAEVGDYMKVNWEEVIKKGKIKKGLPSI